MSYRKAVSLKEGYKSLRLGMSKDEVISLFGEPQSQKIRDGIETFSWWDTEFKGILRGGRMERRVTVEFEDGKVTSFDGHNVDVMAL